MPMMRMNASFFVFSSLIYIASSLSSVTAGRSASLKPPIVYTIAGSDSGGGAGIQADLHAIRSFHCHGCSAITCLTAQNSVGVTEVHSPPAEFLQAQLDALTSDLPPTAIKVGMLGTKELAQQVGNFLKDLRKNNKKRKIWVVFDPVMISTSGHRLIDEHAQQAVVDYVFPYVDVLTPNKFEAEAFLYRKLKTIEDVEQGALDLIEMGAKSVLIKGGHTLKSANGLLRKSSSYAQDYFLSSTTKENLPSETRLCDGHIGVWLRSIRYETEHTHGTGCTLSASMAAALALGERERCQPSSHRRGALSAVECVDAACLAKAYVTAGIDAGVQLGGGPGPVGQTEFPCSAEYFPTIASGDPRYASDCDFVAMRAYDSEDNENIERLGRILPIVNNVEWVERLSQHPGIRDIQLRIKGEIDDDRVREIIKDAQKLCSESKTRLWVNDYWEAAVDAGCFGVHMGQEDLYKCIQQGGMEILQKNMMALGVSVHSFAELSAALSVKPSYISLGPIFSTKSKQVQFDPQGGELVTKFRGLIPQSTPFMVIGGIGDAATARQMRVAGADSVAVIGAVTGAKNPDVAIEELNKAME